MSLSTDKLFEMEQLALCFRWKFTVHEVMSFLCKANFFAQQMCITLPFMSSDSEQHVGYFFTRLFICSHHLSSITACQLQKLSKLQQCLVSLPFALPDSIITVV